MKLNPNVKLYARKYGVAAALAATLVGVVGMTSADASPGDGPYTGSQIVDGTLWMSDMSSSANAAYLSTYNNTVKSISVVDGSLTENDVDAAFKAKLNAVGTGEQGPVGPAGPAGPVGPQGPQGPKGDSAIVTVSAATSLTNRPDSGTAGTWANDTLSRLVGITKHGAVDAAKCGPAATECYLYYVSGTDTGTFATVPGWKTPGAGVNGAGNVSGTVSGAFKGQFYATSATPDPSLVDATVNGAAHPTAEWAKMFFPASVTVTDTELRDWGWTYKAAEFCNTWVNAKAGNSGDITGVNAC